MRAEYVVKQLTGYFADHYNEQEEQNKDEKSPAKKTSQPVAAPAKA